jgi:hypothetical protein
LPCKEKKRIEILKVFLSCFVPNHHREYYGVIDTAKKKSPNEVTANNLFNAVESLDVAPKHPHLHPSRCLDTSE